MWPSIAASTMDIPYRRYDEEFPLPHYYSRLEEKFPSKLHGMEKLYSLYETWQPIDKLYTQDVYQQLRCMPQPGKGVTITRKTAFAFACENTEITQYIVPVLKTRGDWQGIVDFTRILDFQRSQEGVCIRTARTWWLKTRKQDFADRLRKSFNGALHLYEQTCERLNFADSYEFNIEWCGKEMLHYYRALASGELIPNPVGGTPHDHLLQTTYLLAALTPRGRYIGGLLQELHCFTAILEEKGITKDRFFQTLKSLDPENKKYILSRRYSQIGDGALLGWTPSPSPPSAPALRVTDSTEADPFKARSRR